MSPSSANARRASLSGSGRAEQGTQVLQEFYVNATRKLARALSSEEAQAIVLSLSQWGYHRPDAQDILAAAVLA